MGHCRTVPKLQRLWKYVDLVPQWISFLVLQYASSLISLDFHCTHWLLTGLPREPLLYHGSKNTKASPLFTSFILKNDVRV